MEGEWTNGARALCSLIFKKVEKGFEKFQKNRGKKLDIDNDEIYYYAKNQSKNHFILGSGKITSLPKFQTFKLAEPKIE
jgi:hypothetical protein